MLGEQIAKAMIKTIIETPFSPPKSVSVIICDTFPEYYAVRDISFNTNSPCLPFWSTLAVHELSPDGDEDCWICSSLLSRLISADISPRLSK